MKSNFILWVTLGFFFMPGYQRLIDAGECSQLRDHQEWLWCDDFEDGKTLDEKYQDVSTNGFSVSKEDAFDGQYSLQQHYDSGQVGAGWVIRINNNGFPEHLFYRWYHKFEQGFQGFPPKMARVRYQIHSGDWNSPLTVHCWINDGTVVADVLAENSSEANNTGWLPVARSSFSFDLSANVGRWVCFEMEVKLNTPGEKDGLYRIWADSQLIVKRENVDLRGNETYTFNEVMLDCYWNSGSPKPQNRYYDNFVISTRRIGMYTVGGTGNGSFVPAWPYRPYRHLREIEPVFRRRFSGNGTSVSGIVVRDDSGARGMLFDIKGNLLSRSSLSSVGRQ